MRIQRSIVALRMFAGIAATLCLLSQVRAGTNAADVAALQLRWSKGEAFLRHAGTVWGGNFSPDGRLVVTTSSDAGGSTGSACVWDIQAKTRVATLQKPGCGFLSCSVFSPDGKSVLTSGDPGLLVLWDPLTGKEIRTFDKGPITSMYVKYFPNGTQVLTASQWGNNPGMHVWDVASGKIVASFKMEKGGVASFDISPDGKTVVTGDQNSEFSVRLWRMETLAPLWERPREHLGEGGGAVWGVAFSESGKLIAAATAEGCFILDAAKGEILHRLPGLNDGVGVAFLPGDNYLLCTGRRDDFVAKYDVTTGKLVERTPKMGSSPLGLNLSRDKTRAVVGSYNNFFARIIDTRELSDQKSGLGLFDYPIQCVVTPDGSRVITLHSEGSLRWWNAQSGESVEGMARGPVRAENPYFMQMSPDGHTLLFYDYTSLDFIALDLPSGKTNRMHRPEFSMRPAPRVAWASTHADASIYCAVSNGIAMLNLKSGALSPVGGADAAKPFTRREVVTTRKGALFIRSAPGTSNFTICDAGDSQQSSPFALDNGYTLTLCAAVPDGQTLLVAEAGRSYAARLASYPIRPEEAVSAETLDGLIAALGSRTFREREDAEKKLERLGLAAIPALAKAVQSEDPEIKARARPIFTRLSEAYRNGKRPSGVVDLCPGGDEIRELQVSADGRRWVAVLGQSLIMGTVDAGNATLSVATNGLFSGRMAQASVFDDCRRCLTLSEDKTLSMWDLNWNVQTVRTSRVAEYTPGATLNPDDLVACVDDQQLTWSQMEKRVRSYLKADGEATSINKPRDAKEKAMDGYRRKTLALFVNKTVLLNEAGKRKVEVQAADRQKFVLEMERKLKERGVASSLEDFFKKSPFGEEEGRREFEEGLVVDKLIQESVRNGITVSDQDREAFVAEIKAKRQEARQKADDLRAKLIQGAGFAALASKEEAADKRIISTRLEKVTRGKLGDAPLEDALFRQKINEIGPVLDTAHGYLIIQVTGRVAARTAVDNTPAAPESVNASMLTVRAPALPAGKVADSVILNRKTSQALADFLQSLRAKARIETIYKDLEY